MLDLIRLEPGISTRELRERLVLRAKGRTSLELARQRDELISEGLIRKDGYNHWLTPEGELVAKHFSEEAANADILERQATA